jgi:hypothetical protein
MAEERDDGEESQGFAVKDRRRFDADGTEREEATDEKSGPRDAETPYATGGAESATGGERCGPEEMPLPEIDFSTFVLSLSTSAMIHLGEAPSPEGGTQRDLGLAKQTIDILGILEQKTQGNLSDEEKRLLCEVLYDLRLRYVAQTK